MPRQMRARRKTNEEDNWELDQEFSRSVKERDGNRCRMEVWNPVTRKWEECGAKASALNPLDPVHIYDRADVGKKCRYNPIIGICGCRDDHDRYDGKLRDGVLVRVPPTREAVAYKFLQGPLGMKSRLPRRLPPTPEAA